MDGRVKEGALTVLHARDREGRRPLPRWVSARLAVPALIIALVAPTPAAAASGPDRSLATQSARAEPNAVDLALRPGVENRSSSRVEEPRTTQGVNPFFVSDLRFVGAAAVLLLVMMVVLRSITGPRVRATPSRAGAPRVVSR
jgi:hypothetical protein